MTRCYELSTGLSQRIERGEQCRLPLRIAGYAVYVIYTNQRKGFCSL